MCQGLVPLVQRTRFLSFKSQRLHKKKTLKKAAKKAAKKPVAMKQAAKKTQKKAAKKPAAKKPAVRLLFPIASGIVHFYY